MKMRTERKGILFVVSAPSGAGKTTLCREVIKIMDNIGFSVSCTTRSPRPGEQDGRDYHFVDEGTFLKMVERGELAEWARVYHHLYGTRKQMLNKAIDDGEDLFMDIDIQDASQIKASYPQDAVMIFIFPPSLQELKERLVKRAADPPHVIQERWQKAEEEMAMYPLFHYYIVNDNLDRAVQELVSIVTAERRRTSRIKEIEY